MRRLAPLLLAAALLPAATAGAQVEPYQADDFKGFNSINPPGANGLANGPQLIQFLSSGARPPHNDDQLRMYGDLVYATPGLKAGDIGKYFRDGSFGVKAGDVERSYSPRSDVTIQRDRGYGVPHVYGSTRQGAMFGAGYVAGEDRMFFIDVLRHLGRAQLSSFAGGAQGNRDFDHEQWALAPYTEGELQRQGDQLDNLYGSDGRTVQEDVANYVAGVNQYISEAKTNPAKMPGEYAAIGQPAGPDPWKATDVIATASLVGGIFGKGGGGELDSALILQAAQKRFGKKKGKRVWADFRSAEEPEAPTTVHKKRFSYQRPPKRAAKGSVAMPDAGSVKRAPVAGGAASPSGASGVLQNLPLPKGTSNALLVSGRESQSGHPLVVFGPQTAYFAPQILMDIDIHAPTIDARGAAFPGVNLYVQLGRGRDYSWSATSAGQDNTDTYAVDLCERNGNPASTSSNNYMYRGTCRPMERLERSNSWTPSAADQTPPGSETLVAYRTALGIVTARATIKGKPVAYTKLRATYMHEVDSAPGFVDFNNPDKINGPRDFQRAAHKIGYTFNWLYSDDRDIAYFNSGNNPVRPKSVDPNLPVRGKQRFEWRNFDADAFTADYTSFKRHPQVINQSYMTSWNNKQARSYRAADENWGFSSVYRSEPLDDRIKRGIRGNRKMSLPGLIDAMEEAGVVDLRADKVLPWAIRVLEGKARRRKGAKKPQNVAKSDARITDAVAKLKAWKLAGAQRRDRNRDGTYEHADAIRILDGWWPRWLAAQFEPTLGKGLYQQIQAKIGLDNEPNNHGDHLGSAYQHGWYGYTEKDLRTLLRSKVKGKYSRRYCGKGSFAGCQQSLADSLAAAAKVSASQVYGNDSTCTEGGDAQWRFDAVSHRALGGVTQPCIHWINRPTYQQANEIQGHRGR